MSTAEQTIDVKIRALVAGLREVTKLQTELKGIEKTAGKKLSINTTASERGISKLTGLLGFFSSSSNQALQKVDGLSGAMGGLSTSLTGPVGLVLALGAAILGLAKQSSEAAAELFDLSQKTGFAVETLSALNIIGETSGATIQAVSTALGIFQKNLIAAQSGNKALGATFQENNISILDNEQALRDAFRALASMDKGARQTALAMKLFGRSGKDVLGIIKEVDGDLDKAIQSFREMNTLITEDVAKSADELGDSFTVMGQQVSALARGFTDALGPAIRVVLFLLNTLIATLNAAFTIINAFLSSPVFKVAQAMEALSARVSKVADKSLANAQRAGGVFVPGLNSVKDAVERKRGRIAVQFNESGIPFLNTFKDAQKAISKGGGGGGGGGGVEKNVPVAEDTFDSALSLFRERLESSFSLLKDSLERENSLIKDQLEERLISFRDFYEEQGRIQALAIDEEIKKVQGLQFAEQLRHDHELDRIKGDEQRKKLTTDQAAAKREIEENKNKEANVQLEEKLVLLGREREQLAARIARDEKQAREELSNRISDFLDDVDELNGKSAKVAIREINDRLQPLLDRVLQEEGEDSPLAQLIRQFISLVSDRARISELVGRADLVGQEFDTRVAEIQSDVADNILAQARAQEEVNALQREYADRQLVILNQALAIAQANQDSKEISSLRRQIAEVKRLKNEIVDFQEVLENTAINSAVDGLTDMFANIARDAQNAKEYVRDFFLAFLDELNRVIIRMLVMKALMKILGFLAGGDSEEGGDGFFSGIQAGIGEHAAGGHITGPGTGTSDSIPAWLSNGEYVIRASSVRKLGTEFLNFINNVGRVPFASGGPAIFGNMPEPNFFGLGGRGGDNYNFQFARPEDRGFRLPSRAAFRDAARKLRGK